MNKMALCGLLMCSCVNEHASHAWNASQNGATDSLIVYVHVEQASECEDLTVQLLALSAEATQAKILHEEWIDEEGDAWIGPVSKWQDYTLVVRELGTLGEQLNCFAVQHISLPEDQHVFLDLL